MSLAGVENSSLNTDDDELELESSISVSVNEEGR
jgi:hypothetical protein